MPETSTHLNYTDPVFIVGMLRSGTTLLQGILNNTGKYFPVPETHFFSQVTYSLPENDLSLRDRKTIQQILNRKSRIKVPESALSNLNSQKEIFEYVIGMFNPGQINTFLEKTPRHVFFYNKILRYYPTAKFICMVREPKNIVSSRYGKNPNRKKSVIRLSLLYNKIAAAILKILDKDNVILVRYEDLTDENERTLKVICEFLDMAYDGKFLENIVAPKEIVSEHEFWKNNNLTLETIKKNNPDKWRSTLRIDQAHLVNYITRSYAEEFGYSSGHEWAQVGKGFGRDIFRMIKPGEFKKLISKVHG